MTILVWLTAMVTLAFASSKALRSPALFVIFLLAGGLLRFGSDAGDLGVGTLDTSALWLLCLIVLSVVAILRCGAVRERFYVPERLYLLFLAWCAMEAYRAASLAFAVRGFLKLVYPLLVMILARNVIRSGSVATELLKWMMGGAAVGYLLVGGATERFLPVVTWNVAPFFWGAAAFADYAAIMTVVALACWQFLGNQKYLYLALLLGSSSLFVTIRTGILATAVGVGAFVLLRYGARALPALLAIYIGAAAALFLLPEVRAKMFSEKESRVETTELIFHPDEISSDNVASSGRFMMWKVVMDKFFWPDPILGSGLGATQAWFYGGGYKQAKIEHSEYVKLLSDTGVIGLGLFLAALLSGMFTSMRIYQRTDSEVTKVFALIAFASVPTFMACIGFDNALLYVCAAAQYPFAFSAIAIGLDSAQPEAGIPASLVQDNVAAPLIHDRRPIPTRARVVPTFDESET